MTVEELIKLLEKVQHKEMAVYINNPDIRSNLVKDAVIKHRLTDDRMTLTLVGENQWAVTTVGTIDGITTIAKNGTVK